jgi:ATP-dependent DNA helicase RecQ
MLVKEAKHVLNSVFGYDSFRYGQEDIIQTVVEGGDALVLMPTGGGKSLCYQIPAMVRDGVAVVVSPLIALMQDQVDALKQLGIDADFINSSQTTEQSRKIEQQLVAGELKLLYIAPERLLMPRMLALLSTCQIALFAIDEAHCVSQWGHDFRQDYQRLKLLHEQFQNVPCIALTATADQRTRKEIVTQLGLGDAQVFINSFDRPNIHYAISEGNNPKNRLWQFLEQSHAFDAGIVYCLSRKKVEAIADWLTDQGRIALPYHAGLPQLVRQQNQQRFLREEGVIIVATIAFGMGIDKPDVRFVAHLNLPKSIEAYYQETGRAGRDGEPANAWMAYGLQDVITLRQFMQDSKADEAHKRVEHHKLESMLGLCELISCRRQAILTYFDEESEGHCGQCDNCQSPPARWDATEDVRKALSCVYRTEQRFGVNYIIDILLGKLDERIQQNGHDKLSTFGLGQHKKALEWRSVFRQLIALGYVDIDVSRYGALCLTEQCRAVLKGQESIALRQYETPQKAIKERDKKSSVRPQDEVLWEALRALRMRLAEALGVPPYVVFHDATLQAMLKFRPDNLAKMAKISGVGEQKLLRYGDDFIAEIVQHPLSSLLDNRLSPTVNVTLLLYEQGMAVDAIAVERAVKETTIYGHFAEAIEVGLIDVNMISGLSESDYLAVVRMIESFGDDEKGKLKPVYDALDGEFDYGILRCIRASM